MIGGSIKINGTFTIDVGTWNLQGVNVYATSMSTIVINNNCTMDARPNPNGNVPTQFDICLVNPSWSGIQVSSGGTILLTGCIVLRACTGVDLRPGSKAKIVGNNFLDNYYGIMATGNVTLMGDGIAHNNVEIISDPISDCSVDSNGEPFSNPHALHLKNVPFIAIGNQDLTGLPNTIRNYRNGISATNSNLDVFNSTFYDRPFASATAIDLNGVNGVYTANIFGLGGLPVSPPIVSNYGHGIFSKNYNLFVKNARFTTILDSEIEITESPMPTQLNVSESRFERFGSNGILLYNSKFSKIDIAKNEFRDNRDDEVNYRSGIRINVSNVVLPPYKGFVSENKFYDDLKANSDPFISYQHYAAWILSTPRIKLEDNFFYQNYLSPTGIEHEYKGVWVNNSNFCEIVSNSFLGNFGAAQANNTLKYHGLEDYSSTKCYISCNYAENLDAGFYFKDPGCNPVNFRLNTMGGNVDDLYLESGTIIGEQKDKENKWPDSSPTEARFDGNPTSGALFMSRFLINTSNQNSPLWADPRVPGNGWFVFSGGSPSLSLPCFKDEQDPTDPPQPRAGRMVIDGTFEPYKGYAASTWEASLGAFSVLMVHPELRPTGSPDALFYNLHNTGNVGKLQRAREAWDNIALFSASLESSWSNNQTAVSQKLDEIRVQNQQMQQAQTPAQQVQIAQTLTTLKGELTALQQTNQSLSAQYLSEVASRANLLLSDLGAISATDVWESNLKTVLTLLAQRQLVGNAAWTESQQNTLQTIANQCRHAGGIGVVIARAALEKFDYDDEAMCPGFSQPRSEDATRFFNTTLFPNPANDICHIAFDKAVSGMLTLCDPQGRIQRSIQLTDAGSFDLNTQNLPAGLYYVQVKGEQRLVCLNKLAIVH